MVRIFDEQKLLIASGNEGKVREIRELFQGFPFTITSAATFDLSEPAETGLSFRENAEIKALYYGNKTGLPALADDSGLVIPALNGQPGIHSARWAGPGKDFAVATERIQKELFEVHGGEYTINDPAHFICALTIYWPDGEHWETFEGRVDGHLCFPPVGDKGFGYDPIFIPEGYTTTFGQMAPAAKHAISHRADAFRQLIAECFQAQNNIEA